MPRFRDCYVDENDRVVVYTRTGGGNRDYYESEDSCRENYPEYFNGTSDDPAGPWNEDLRGIPGFLFDKDDDYDSTYAKFYFALPDELAKGVIEIAKEPREKWSELFDVLNRKVLDKNEPTDAAKSAKAQ